MDKIKENTEKKIACFDIETFEWIKSEAYLEYQIQKTGRLVDPVKIEKKKEELQSKFALNYRTGQIIQFGILTNVKFKFPYDNSLIEKTEHGFLIQEISRNPSYEIELLDRFFYLLENLYDEGFQFVSKGGKRFDLPFALSRAFICDLKVKGNYLTDMLHKYRNYPHLDIESVLEGGLAELAYLINLSDHIQNKGNEIAQMYLDKDYDNINLKNKEDLIYTMEIYKRVEGWV